MEYKVLYRKYRPLDFDNIVDQEYIIKTLRNAIKKENISHAYIFSGPRGTGKTSTAKVFAKSINCEAFNELGPCGKCKSCKSFIENPDIVEIDAASNNGVDEIREIINNVKLAPTSLKYKVYIIDEVHMLSQSAFNALLLTLEEPPKHVVFILATTNIESVPLTILSRCQRFDFKKISEHAIVNRLKDICTKEKINIEDEALKEIAYMADGGLRDALSLLDQLISLGGKITADEVVKRFGTVSQKTINEVIDCIENHDSRNLLKIFSNLKELSLDYKQFCKKLIDELYKKAVLIKNNAKNSNFTYETIKKIIFDLVECVNKSSVNVDSFMLIELVLLEYIKPDSFNDIEANVQIKEETTSGESQKTIDYKIDVDARLNNCFVGAERKYLNQIVNSWEDFVEAFKEDRKAYGAVIDTKPVVASADYVVLSTALKPGANLLNSIIDNLEKYYHEVFNETKKFVVITDEKWEKEKAKYIENKKDNHKYKYIEENSEKNKSPKKDFMEETAKNIFEKKKIEVK